MSKRLIAALLLLIFSGSGAVFTWYAGAAEAELPVSEVPQVTATVQIMAEVEEAPEPTATSTPVPPTPEPVEEPPAPEPTAQIPTDLPSSPRDEPEPTPEPIENAEPESTEVPQWSVVAPPRWAPTRLHIPDIDVDSRIVGVALTDTGEMEAPQNYEEIGWYRLGAKPGEPGRSVMAGHVDSKTGPAVFYRLRDLTPGTVIEVTLGGNAEMLRYVVREIEQYPEDNAPLERIFGPSDVSELILITCSGDFDFSRDAYPDRLVVYADLMPESS